MGAYKATRQRVTHNGHHNNRNAGSNPDSPRHDRRGRCKAASLGQVKYFAIELDKQQTTWYNTIMTNNNNTTTNENVDREDEWNTNWQDDANEVTHVVNSRHIRLAD